MAVSDEQRSEVLLQNIDTSDCGIVALQAITGWTRAQAEARAGQRYAKGTGMMRGTIEATLREHGWVCAQVPRTEQQGETPGTWAFMHEAGMWLVYTERHVMALVDGDLHNSRGHWHRPVEGIVRVHR